MGLLPAGYKRLEYIQSSAEGTYINLNIAPSSNNLKIIAEVQPTIAVSTQNVFLQINPTATSTTGAMLQLGTFSSKWQVHVPNVTVNGSTTATTARWRINFDVIGTTYTFGGATAGTGTNTYFNTGTWRNQKITVGKGSYRHYGYEIYFGGKLQRLLIPVKNASGTIGMYDVITGTFYANVGSGSYTSGPEIADTDVTFKQVEYIQSSGAQYVDAGFKPNQNSKIDIVVSSTQSKSACMCGSVKAWQNDGFAMWVNAISYDKQIFGVQYYDGVVRKLTLDKNRFLVDDVLTHTFTAGTFAPPANMYIFAANVNGTAGEFTAMRLYSCQIYDNGAQIRKYVPHVTALGTSGLMDTLNNAFYASVSATDFAAGPEVITVPLAPEGLTANVSSGVLTLSWTASENAEGYDVYRNGEYVATTFDTTFTDTINPAIAYEYGVTAYNEHGKSEMSTVAVPATQVPEQVADLRAVDAGFNYITLTWDNVAGADAYRVFRDGTLLSEQAEVGYSDSGLKTETAYTYGVSAVNEVGENAMVEITVSTTDFKLVTDRTAADVQRVLDLSKALPTENMEEWLAGMKGSYNVFDLNRVELAVLYVIERLRIAGWYITVESKTDWKLSDFPTVSEMTRYLNNIRKLRSALPNGLPAVPAYMDEFTYNEANDIERLLEMLDAAVTNIMANVFYSNELYSGEVM